MKKKVFVYVGHSNWGKSMALRELTGGSSRKKIACIQNTVVRVRKMSNDDDGERLLEWVKGIRSMRFDCYVIAFCPKMISDPSAQTALEILAELRCTCELYYFIQEEKFGASQCRISPEEVRSLGDGSELEILIGQNDYHKRAIEFKKFIEAHLEA